jgi:excinuclease ABC subunit A
MKDRKNYIRIKGASEHNLKNLDLDIPRDEFVVLTGLSGSGKSSLAFDTIYAEGQRRYMESLSAYARQFIGNMERPQVDDIKGLSPVISIEQKSVNKNPRSTVGTITEIYDYLRLLYARVAEPFSYNTGEKMVRYSEEQICDIITKTYKNKRINILAPVVRARKGHYRELFENIRQQGFLRVRIDGDMKELAFGMQVDRYKTHDIEIVIDRLLVGEDKSRISKAIELAFKHGKGLLLIMEEGDDKVRYFSRLLMCPTTGLSYQDPEPNSFSFNSPYGACPKCNGLGEITEEYASRLRRIGDWYNRMEGCLEGAEGDSFDYSVRHDSCIVNRKNGKLYFHLYNSASSSAVDIKYFPNTPKRIRLLNTGADLSFSFECLPEFFNGKTGKADHEYLHITGIPIDELSNEAIALEIEIEEN